jgi:hypothetical protein
MEEDKASAQAAVVRKKNWHKKYQASAPKITTRGK